MQTKWLKIGLLATGLLLGWCRPGTALEDHVGYGMTEKGTHGLVDIGSGWMEFPLQTYRGYNDGASFVQYPALKYPLGGLLGMMRGATHTAGRTTWGVVTLMGFWTSNPPDNKSVLFLLDGEYAWDKGTKKTIFAPTFKNGFYRLWSRYARGIEDPIIGLGEIPGQAYKTSREGHNWLRGVPRGMWFSVSRCYNGLADLILLPLPGPEMTFGVPYDELKPNDALRGKFYTTYDKYGLIKKETKTEKK